MCLLAKEISTSMCLERCREKSSKESKEEENEDLKVTGKNFDKKKFVFNQILIDAPLSSRLGFV